MTSTEEYRCGRRNSIRLSTFLCIIFMLVSPYSPNFWTFIGIQFFIGLSCGGILSISATYVVEIFGPECILTAGCYSVLPNGLAIAALSIFAYLSSTWDIFIFSYWIVCVLIFFLVLLLPETPRWYLCRGRVDNAIVLITKAAVRNKLNISDINDVINKTAEHMNIEIEGDIKDHNYRHLFRNIASVITNVYLFILFFAAGGTYLYLPQYVTFVGSNNFMDVALLGLIQVPASFLPIALDKYFGRRNSLAMTFVITGVSLAALVFMPKSCCMYPLFGVIGVWGVSSSFIILNILAAELFSTPIRNMGLGCSYAAVSIGALSSTFLRTLDLKFASSSFFAVISLLAAFISVRLPETKGVFLKDVF